MTGKPQGAMVTCWTMPLRDHAPMQGLMFAAESPKPAYNYNGTAHHVSC